MISERIREAVRDPHVLGVLQGLAVGDTQAMTPEQWRVFAATGTTHLMAISGLHISMVAALAAALGGLDAMVFTAGVGENSAHIRERVCQGASWLGVALDPAANAKGGPCISDSQSRVSAWVVPTNEELLIARHTLRVLGMAKGKKQQEFAAAA